MDRRQGNFEKAIQEFNEAISRDPRNAEAIAELGNTLFWTRQFSAAERAYDRLIELVPSRPMFQGPKGCNFTGEERRHQFAPIGACRVSDVDGQRCRHTLLAATLCFRRS